MHDLPAIAAQFTPAGRVLEIQAYGRGNVHDTFLVTGDGPGEPRFILQRLNTRIFRQPRLVMENLAMVSDHVRRRLLAAPLSAGRRFEVPRLLAARDGRDQIIDAEGSFWRALTFIPGRSFHAIQDGTHARQVGYALGLFHRLLSDLDPNRLSDTLPGFHNTPGYLQHHDEVLAAHCPTPSAEVDYCLEAVARRRAWAGVLEEAKAQGRLTLRPIHGDPKVDNVLVDPATGAAVGLVDLDTVKPGLVQYDIGDCLRSGANPRGEDLSRWAEARFEAELGRAILAGYLPQAAAFLTEDDYAYLYDAIRLLAFELGLRFFTDHLEGDVYFKAAHRGHNLGRALAQFKLMESIESQEAAIQTMIRELR